RHPAGAEAVVLGDQLFGDYRVFDTLTDLPRDEVGDQRIRFPVDEDVAEVALPDAEARLAVELFEERLALLRGHVGRLARVGRMDEAAGGLAAAREDLGIAGPDPAHLLPADLVVVQGRAPVGGA